jgi:hypothetical protein
VSRNEDIDNGIWDDPEFERLSPHAKLLYIWSWTNRSTNMAGLYRVSKGLMGFQTGIAPQDVDAALAELEASEFAFYKDDYLWVRSRVKRIRSRTVQIAKAVAKDITKVGDEHPLKVRFLEKYGEANWLKSAISEAHLNLTRTSPEVHAIPDEQGKSVNLTRTSSEPHLRFQGNGRGSSKGGPGGEDDLDDQLSAARDRLRQDLPPPDFPLTLMPALDAVTEVIGELVQRHGGKATRHRLALAVAEFPNRDHRAVVRELSFWAAKDERRPVKDWGQTFRTFLKGATDRPASKPTVDISDVLGRGAA